MATDDKKFTFGPIQPWEDIVVCTKAPEEYTEQGVAIGGGATDDKKKPEKGLVFAVGPASDLKKKLPYDIKPGDLIFYERYTANEIPDGGEIYNFVRFKYIMGVKKQK